MFLVDLARFERATSTFAESRSDSAELQVQAFAIANCRLPIAHLRSRYKSWPIRQLAIANRK